MLTSRVRAEGSASDPGAAIVKFLQVFYVIDPELRVLWVGGDWDDFAQANGGQAVRANRVLGTDLARYLAGDQTLAEMRRIIAAVQETRRTFRMEYRCDSPDLRRDVRLTVTPMRDCRLLLTHDLRDARHFPTLGDGWTYQPGAEAVKCGFCCALLQPDGSWADPFDLGLGHPPQVDYHICPACTATVDAEIARMHRAGRAD